MTTNEAIALFSYLADERGSPNFEDDEVIDLLNMAQLERLKRLLPDDQSPVLNFELDQNTLFNVRQLIYPVTTTMTSAGVVTFSSLNTALQTASSDNGCTVHRIVDIAVTASGVERPAKFTKNNNWSSYKRNYFKAGASTAPRYKVDATNLTFEPVDVNASVRVNCMKTPKV